MSEIENEQELTDAEYFEKIREAEKELEKVRIASIEYLETLAKTEQAVNERKKSFGNSLKRVSKQMLIH